MTDLATRIGCWLDGTVTPGPDGGWVADARWTGIKGMVFVLRDDAARAAYLDRARPHAMRAAIAESVVPILSAVWMAMQMAIIVGDAFAGGTRANHLGLHAAVFGTVCLLCFLLLRTWLGAVGLRTWLREAGATSPVMLAPSIQAPLPTLRGLRMSGFVLLALACAAGGAALTVATAGCLGFLSVPAASCRVPWLHALLAFCMLGAAGSIFAAAWYQHRRATA